MCITHGRERTVTVEKILLSLEEVAELLCTLPSDSCPDTAVRRKFKRKNGPSVSMSIYPLAATTHNMCVSVREKQSNSKGFGSVAIYDNNTRELEVCRYAVEHAHQVLHNAMLTLYHVHHASNPKKLYVETDIPATVAQYMWSDSPPESNDLHHVHIMSCNSRHVLECTREAE